MNGSPDPRQSYPENVPPQNTPAQYAQPAPGSGWHRDAAQLGVDPRLAGDPRRKSPVLAFLLSGMPGLGQVYVGYYNQGFLNMAVCGGTIFLLNATGRTYGHVHGLDAFLGFFLAFYWLYNMVDAYRRAMFYNQSLAGLGPVEIPEDMKMPKARGSLAGGVALILVGLLLFANTALGMSLDWLDQWWPIGLVLLGAWLVYRSVSEKQKDEAPRVQTTEPAERS